MYLGAKFLNSSTSPLKFALATLLISITILSPFLFPASLLRLTSLLFTLCLETPLPALTRFISASLTWNLASFGRNSAKLASAIASKLKLGVLTGIPVLASISLPRILAFISGAGICLTPKDWDPIKLPALLTFKSTFFDLGIIVTWPAFEPLTTSPPLAEKVGLYSEPSAGTLTEISLPQLRYSAWTDADWIWITGLATKYSTVSMKVVSLPPGKVTLIVPI